MSTHIWVDGSFNIQIDTATMKQVFLDIKGFTESGVQAILPIYIEVCGLEIIGLNADIFKDGLVVFNKSTSNTGTIARWNINHLDY